MKRRLTCIRVVGREKNREGKKQVMIHSKPHHLSNMVETMLCHGHKTASGTGPVMIIDDVTAEAIVVLLPKPNQRVKTKVK